MTRHPSKEQHPPAASTAPPPEVEIIRISTEETQLERVDTSPGFATKSTPGPPTAQLPPASPAPAQSSSAPAAPAAAQPAPARPAPADPAADHRRAMAPTHVPSRAGDDREKPVPLLEPSRRLIELPVSLAPDRRLSLLTSPSSATAEHFRVLALGLRERMNHRVVAVLAPDAAGEASVIASNLALALGEGGRHRVLLVDADLRQPALGRLFGTPSGPGLTEQADAIRRVPSLPWEVMSISASLSLLPAGPPANIPSLVLGSAAVVDLVAVARRVFDFVIFSAPPALESADASILQDLVDGTILVVRGGVSERQAVSTSIDRVGRARFIGVVLVETSANQKSGAGA